MKSESKGNSSLSVEIVAGRTVGALPLIAIGDTVEELTSTSHSMLPTSRKLGIASIIVTRVQAIAAGFVRQLGFAVET
jgi:hypothetical protein